MIDSIFVSRFREALKEIRLKINYVLSNSEARCKFYASSVPDEKILREIYYAVQKNNEIHDIFLEHIECIPDITEKKIRIVAYFDSFLE